jgi:DNA-binding beta-propeller fold protein YncE
MAQPVPVTAVFINRTIINGRRDIRRLRLVTTLVDSRQMRKVSRTAAPLGGAQPWLRAAALALLLCPAGDAAEAPALAREANISLGKVEGRIDHLAVDLVRRRLFVAELGNDTVGVVDLGGQRLLQTLAGLHEPQGVGYSASTDELFVTNGGDGSVSIFSGESLMLTGQMRLGDDADNVRLLAQPSRVLIGYGQGALAMIDATRKSRMDFPLKGHPEGFQVLKGGARVLVNVPDRNEIAVVDIPAAKQTASWPLGEMNGNFPMAIDESDQVVWVATRQPAKLIAMDVTSGARKAVLESCGDADDIMIDARRHRIYVSCGSGHIDVWDTREGKHLRIARLETSPGARTALFVPELDRLYVAVRANQDTPAAIWVYRPTSAPP